MLLMGPWRLGCVGSNGPTWVPIFINIDRLSAVPLFTYLDRVVEVGTSCKIRLNIVCIKSKWTTVTTL
jgi:hypothetical protein